MKTLYFFLFSSILFLAACTDSQNLIATECEAVEEGAPNHYTEYEGTVSMARDSQSFYLEHSDQPERNEFIDIRWSYGEHIYFVSEKFEFDKWDSEIWGGDECAKWDAGGKEQIVDDNNVNWLYFEPADEFWACLESENFDPGDPVFDFHLMAREKRN